MNTKKRNLFFLLIFTYAIIPVVIFGQSITPPQCYSGKRLLKEFIKEELVYPGKALQDKTEGTVEISFMVNKDGSTSNYRIVKSVSNDLDNEAIRICRKILWYPAVDLGRPVDYENKFEIKCDIKKYEKICRSKGYEKTEYPFLPIDTGNMVFLLVDID
ncbi:MAG: energy transducer TonB, partial [Bacteroidales bacterium]|nr:energy transducer TonB [Bacteroidales bacterium]